MIPKDELIQLYVEEGKSTYEIAKIKYCSHTTVYKLLNEYGVETRSIGEGLKQKYNFKPKKIKKLLETNKQFEIAEIYGCNPATISKVIKKFKMNGEW